MPEAMRVHSFEQSVLGIPVSSEEKGGESGGTHFENLECALGRGLDQTGQAQKRSVPCLFIAYTHWI